ncbi:MAG: hypothetical protein J6R40_01290 [Clostridia bacterium]|nr:hypothetical protein [Clostridia bacterium]
MAKLLPVLIALALIVSISGVYATWRFYYPLDPISGTLDTDITEFQYGPPETIHITNVEVVSNSSQIKNLVQMPSLPTKVIASASVAAANTTITYKITVFNNTDVTYWYRGVTPASSDLPSNALIGTNGGISISTKDKLQDNSATFNTEDWVPPRTVREFYATYTFGRNATGEISTMVNFHFGLQMDSVYDGFLKILNDKISENGYYYLADVFDEKYAKTGSNVIANVGDELEIFNNLFGGPLYVDVDGTQVPVTVMVQRKDVDNTANGDSYSPRGDSGCEYSVFISIPSLMEGQNATVYAVSYTCKNTGSEAGVWYQIGQLYEGTAPLVTYDGVAGGAFNVDKWQALPNQYDLGYGLSYKCGYEQGDQFEKMLELKQLMSTQDSSFGNKINGNRLFTNVYNIVKGNPNSEAPEIANLRKAWNDIEPYFVIYNNGGTIWFDGNRWTRAEILPYLVHLIDAYEYYLQVHG